MKTIFKTLICTVLAFFALTSAAQSAPQDDNDNILEQKECCVGDTIYLRGVRHGSVGLDCSLQYDESAFNVEASSTYDHPGRSQMPGGDKQTIVFTVICKKRGSYLIKMIENFRGQITPKDILPVLVK